MNQGRTILQNRFLQGGFVLVLALLVAVGVNMLQGERGAIASTSMNLKVDPTPGSLAPDFTLATVDGEVVSLSEFRGKTVLVNFWATWCGPCQIEMPAIQDRFEKFYEDGFVLGTDTQHAFKRSSHFATAAALVSGT